MANKIKYSQIKRRGTKREQSSRVEYIPIDKREFIPHRRGIYSYWLQRKNVLGLNKFLYAGLSGLEYIPIDKTEKIC